MPEFRRAAPAGPPPEGDPVLAARIRDEILSSGPMTFARFMELVLYDPERGYYRAEAARPGREGDFLTAPETHPVFGHALARSIAQMWEVLGHPDPFTVREYGAGAGALALAMLGGLRADGSRLLGSLRYEPIEVGERRLAELGGRLAAAGFARVLGTGGPDAGRFEGCVVANEFLDALPVHRIEFRDGRLLELYVGWRAEAGPSPAPGVDGAFIDVPGPPSTPEIEERLVGEGIELAEGQRAEVCLAIGGWLSDVSDALGRGFVLLVDYGHPATELYGPARHDGTLRAYVRHTVTADPYVRVGRQDLTAHVDITAVTAEAARCGLAVLGTTTQAEFLVGAGLEGIVATVQADPATSLGDYFALRASLARLLDPRATGGFPVVVLGRGVPDGARLDALAFRLRR